MTFGEAFQRIAMAGRELGSGPAVAARRIIKTTDAEDYMLEHGFNPDTAAPVGIGVAIGLVMAEEEKAMAELELIARERYQ